MTVYTLDVKCFTLQQVDVSVDMYVNVTSQVRLLALICFFFSFSGRTRRKGIKGKLEIISFLVISGSFIGVT